MTLTLKKQLISTTKFNQTLFYMLKYLILILLLSPALSIVALFGLPFFPNEKIAFLLILMNFIFVS